MITVGLYNKIIKALLPFVYDVKADNNIDTAYGLECLCFSFTDESTLEISATDGYCLVVFTLDVFHGSPADMKILIKADNPALIMESPSNEDICILPFEGLMLTTNTGSTVISDYSGDFPDYGEIVNPSEPLGNAYLEIDPKRLLLMLEIIRQFLPSPNTITVKTKGSKRPVVLSFSPNEPLIKTVKVAIMPYK